MEVKELAEKIKELNIDSCTSCPFKRDYCELHGVACIDVNENLGFAESLLQLEHFFETGAIKKILEEEKND